METLRDKILRVHKDLIEIGKEIKKVNESHRDCSCSDNDYIDWVNNELFNGNNNISGFETAKFISKYLDALDMVQELNPVKVICFDIYEWKPYILYIPKSAADDLSVIDEIVKCPECNAWVCKDCPDCICGHHFFDIKDDGVMVEYNRDYDDDFVSKYSHPAPDTIRYEIECNGKVFRADYKLVEGLKELDFKDCVNSGVYNENPYLHRYMINKGVVDNGGIESNKEI